MVVLGYCTHYHHKPIGLSHSIRLSKTCRDTRYLRLGFFEYIGVLLGHGKLFTYLLYLTVVLTLNPSKVPEVRKYLSTWLCSIRLSPKSFPAPIVYCGTGSGSSLFFWLFNCLLILLLVLFGTESGFSIGVRGLLSYSVVVAGRSPSMPASPGSRVEEVLFL